MSLAFSAPRDSSLSQSDDGRHDGRSGVKRAKQRRQAESAMWGKIDDGHSGGSDNEKVEKED